MKKILLVILFLSVAYLGLTLALQPKLRQILRAPATTNQPPVVSQQEPKDHLTYACERGKTVFDLLQQKTGGQIEVKSYSFGQMINTINGLKGGTDGKYWIYFVDDKAGTISADNYKCQDSEKIDWKFIKPE